MKEYVVTVFEDGSRCWYLDGKLHREDGPAVERVDGTKYWYLNGQELTEEEHDGVLMERYWEAKLKGKNA